MKRNHDELGSTGIRAGGLHLNHNPRKRAARVVAAAAVAALLASACGRIVSQPDDPPPPPPKQGEPGYCGIVPPVRC
jgi:hypothetical protein